jgi:ABC-type lipoprotein release transport system permease subunit
VRVLTRIAWRNLWRHRRRTLLTAVAMAVGAALCMATTAFSDGMFDELFAVMVEQQLGHVQVHHPDHPSSRRLHDTLKGATALVEQVRALPDTAAVSGKVVGFALVGTEKKSTGAVIVGVDPEAERGEGRVGARIREGVFLPRQPGGKATIGVDLAEELGVKLGDSVVAVTQSADGSLGNAAYEIVGIHRTGDAQLDRTGLVIHVAEAQELLVLPDQLHSLTVLTEDPSAIAEYTEQLRGSIGSDKVAVKAWWEASPQAAQLMGMRDFGALITLGVVFTAAAFGVLNTMMMSVYERTRELGVLKALGLKPLRIVALIVVESALLAAVAAFLGLVLGGLLDLYLVVYGFDLSASVEEGFSFSGVMLDPVIRGSVRPVTIVYVILAVFVVSIGASLWPAVRASRLQPVEAMRAE